MKAAILAAVLCLVSVSAVDAADYWVQDKTFDGSIVILNGGHTFAIDPLDRIDTSLWLRLDNIHVLGGGIGGQYRLVNTSGIGRADVVGARYLGRR